MSKNDLITSGSKAVPAPRGVIHQRPHAYWVGFLATALLRISRSKTLKEARGIARDGLNEVADPILGPREINDDTRTRWRAEARKGDDE